MIVRSCSGLPDPFDQPHPSPGQVAHHYVVAVDHPRIDHRVTRDPQHEQLTLAAMSRGSRRSHSSAGAKYFSAASLAERMRTTRHRAPSRCLSTSREGFVDPGRRRAPGDRRGDPRRDPRSKTRRASGSRRGRRRPARPRDQPGWDGDVQDCGVPPRPLGWVRLLHRVGVAGGHHDRGGGSAGARRPLAGAGGLAGYVALSRAVQCSGGTHSLVRQLSAFAAAQGGFRLPHRRPPPPATPTRRRPRGHAAPPAPTVGFGPGRQPDCRAHGAATCCCRSVSAAPAMS
jgi:hypothetical protein